MEQRDFIACAQIHKDMVFRLALSYTKNKEDADDITQNVLIKLLQADFDTISTDHVRNWLVRVTINECRKLWRSPWSKREDIEAYLNQLPFQDPETENLLGAVMKLERKYRMVIYLYYYEDYSIAEIAEYLGIPTGTVGTRLSRARKKLKEVLKEEEYEG